MPLLDKSLIIKRSTIPGAGKGLFTKDFIAKGTRITKYKGRITTWKEVQQQPGFNAYVYYIKRSFVIDAKNFIKSAGRYANDAAGLTRIKGITNNCTYVNEGESAFIESLKDIQPGEELLAAYGKEYWDAVRHNIKHGFI